MIALAYFDTDNSIHKYNNGFDIFYGCGKYFLEKACLLIPQVFTLLRYQIQNTALRLTLRD